MKSHDEKLKAQKEKDRIIATDDKEQDRQIKKEDQEPHKYRRKTPNNIFYVHITYLSAS